MRQRVPGTEAGLGGPGGNDDDERMRMTRMKEICAILKMKTWTVMVVMVMVMMKDAEQTY